MEEINKISETSGEIVVITPEHVIPQKVEKTEVSLVSLQEQKSMLEKDIERNIGFKEAKNAEVATIDKDIANIQARLDKVIFYIGEFKAKGIVEVVATPEIFDAPAEEQIV